MILAYMQYRVAESRIREQIGNATQQSFVGRGFVNSVCEVSEGFHSYPDYPAALFGFIYLWILICIHMEIYVVYNHRNKCCGHYHRLVLSVI
jgi:hypothetical protein